MAEDEQKSDTPSPAGIGQSPDTSDNATVAKSAAKAFIGRLGALIEVIGLPAFAWLYGASTMGVYFTLWAVIRVTTRITEFAMPTALQRFVPQSECPERAASIVKSAMTVSLGLSLALALAFTIFAPNLAPLINADETDSQHLVTIIRIYAWVLPFWTAIEVLTATVRAQRKFGPEIRIRIFYEQGLRLVAGVGLYFIGFQTLGIFYAHLFSVVVAALLAVRLSTQFYDYRAVLRAPFDWKLTKEMLSYTSVIMPALVIKDLLSEVPVLLLNQLLPGAQGATAAGHYGVARRIASVLVVVRHSFEYVIAPFASVKNATQKRDELQDMYSFSTRLICCIIVPLSALLLLVRHEVLYLFGPDFKDAAGIILVLACGRMLESLTGPACALVEMLGHRVLPLINGLMGLIALVVLIYILTPEYGAVGAAIAAAIAINITSLLGLAEAFFLYRLQPYHRTLIKPFAIAVGSTLVMAWLGDQAGGIDNVLEMVTDFGGFFLTLTLIVRYGFQPQDVNALGRLGRWLSAGR